MCGCERRGHNLRAGPRANGSNGSNIRALPARWAELAHQGLTRQPRRPRSPRGLHASPPDSAARSGCDVPATWRPRGRATPTHRVTGASAGVRGRARTGSVREMVPRPPPGGSAGLGATCRAGGNGQGPLPPTPRWRDVGAVSPSREQPAGLRRGGGSCGPAAAGGGLTFTSGSGVCSRLGAVAPCGGVGYSQRLAALEAAACGGSACGQTGRADRECGAVGGGSKGGCCRSPWRCGGSWDTRGALSDAVRPEK